MLLIYRNLRDDEMLKKRFSPRENPVRAARLLFDDGPDSASAQGRHFGEVQRADQQSDRHAGGDGSDFGSRARRERGSHDGPERKRIHRRAAGVARQHDRVAGMSWKFWFLPFRIIPFDISTDPMGSKDRVREGNSVFNANIL